MKKEIKIYHTFNPGGKIINPDRIGQVRLRGNYLVSTGMSRSEAFKQAHYEYNLIHKER